METTLESTDQKPSIWATGLAMFSMFFGAGNIVFPLALGQLTQNKSFFGVSGLIITAVFVPLMGLLAMLLFNGDYMAFFRRIGRLPGSIVAVMILGMIGPFAGIPRCITISFSTLNAFGLEEIKGVNLTTFSLVSCFVIFLFTFKPNKILTLLGYVLTPVLLLSLGFILVKGLFQMPSAEASSYTGWQTFSMGVLEGYNTMDLLAAFFFSSVVLLCLRKGQSIKEVSVQNSRRLITVACIGSLIAASLLALIYLCFSHIAAGYSRDLSNAANHEMLGTLAYQILGPYAGMIASVAVSFACLTTEIALTAVFAEFLHETVFKEKLPFSVSILLTLSLAFLVSTLHFEGISAFMGPILKVCYPALILLSVLNILHKLYGFQNVKRLFYGTLTLTFVLQLLT
ncbi:MAG: Branched-chain amino acid transport system 2 carrier protein [Chlamydiales bacterium]|nr:Branched-chain amino acid transport system 2 carrier protein [Chlamydiales bacterium]